MINMLYRPYLCGIRMWFLFLLSFISLGQALDNGLALTPPMGWLTWERYRCITDCKKYPNECISEDLIKRIAKLMVTEGYLEAGYEYIGIDDCWLERTRGSDGRMVADKERFPSGMKALADYIHGLGLKFGMYQDYGTSTCAGYPGVLGHEKVDVQTFLEWEIDYLKLDGCYVNTNQMDTGYPEFGRLLNATGRPILYSCSWPAYQETYNLQRSAPGGRISSTASFVSRPSSEQLRIGARRPDYASIAEHCNLWRNWGDIQDSWGSMTRIMDWFGNNQDRIAKYSGPGRWNDPDMLIIGNYGLSVDQAKVQMAVWAVLAAPLLASTDLATIRPEFKEILLNKDIIAVNQDIMGKQGLRVLKNDTGVRAGIQVWKRELYDGSYAMAFVSYRTDGAPFAASFTKHEIGMSTVQESFEIQDLYKEEPAREWHSNDKFEVRINPTGVKFYKFIPRNTNELRGSE